MLITLRDLEAAISRVPPSGSAAVAERLLRWADAVEPRSEVNRGELLLAAAEQYGAAGQAERRVELCRRVVADSEVVHPDARCYLVSALLDAGQDHEARALAGTVRREPGLHGHVLESLGHSFASAGHHVEALNLFEQGLDGPVLADDGLGLLLGRRLCRAELGLPPDHMDSLVLTALAGTQDLAREVDLVGVVPREGCVGEETYEEQVRRIECDLRHRPSGLPVALVDLPVRPGQALSRPRQQDYLLEQDRLGRTRPWPPGRNEPCWCGSGMKYKRCCLRAALS